ncbi:MAG: radical SAM protein [Phycisphaerae bacterium]|nr:radical SAM protein [Phycisphaerae bacterium]
MTEVPKNVAKLREMIRDCALCPRRCGVDRTAGKLGSCGVGPDAVVASAGPHFGEEPVLVGAGGSGTIFFSGCNLGCIFCQNYDISHSVNGHLCPPAEIAALAVGLEARGCENINFVTPTHVAHAVAEAVVVARSQGLTAPIVYNCGGYESLEALQLLEGLIEIYMPDFKYASADAGRKYSSVDDYPAAAERALAEMFRQVGPLELDDRGVATGGVLVRHLVMPGDTAKSREVIDIVARTAPGCTINVMAQYRPCYRAHEFAELTARPSAAEVESLRRRAADAGLKLAR